VSYANILDPDEMPGYSTFHTDKSCLTLNQLFCQKMSISVKFENEADEILCMHIIASGSEGVGYYSKN